METLTGNLLLQIINFRSPHSNKYFPHLEDGKVPTQELRELEVKLNASFAAYIKNYYAPTAICSVYAWELGNEIKEGFCVAILIKNSVNDIKQVDNGTWDSTNFFTVNFKEDANNYGAIKAVYTLTTTVILQMVTNHKVCGNITVSGSMTRQVNQYKYYYFN